MQLRFCAAGSSREAAKGCGSNIYAAEGGVKAAERQKDLIGLVRSRHCGELNRGLQNLDSFFEKGFNFVSGKFLFGWAESRFAEPRSFPVRKTDWYFLRRAKSTAKTRRGLRPSGLPGTIQSSAGNTFGEVSSGTSRTRFFAQNGGEKALNRCEIPVLQRKDLGRRLKEQPYSFADSKLWLGGNLWCLEWKRIALDSKKKRFGKRKAFGLQKKATFKCS